VTAHLAIARRRCHHPSALGDLIVDHDGEGVVLTSFLLGSPRRR
jgi:hypothetical protein